MESEGIARLRALGEQVKELRAQMKAAAQEALKEGTKEVFAEYSDVLHSFGWVQYAPAFNDGEPCEFSMHDLILISKVDIAKLIEEEGADYAEDAASDWWSDSGSPSFGGWRGKCADERHQEALDAAKIIYDVIDEDLSREIFGDAVKVIFTPEGIDTEEYYDGY